MKILIYTFAAFLTIAASASSVVVSNQVLMVDQNGRLNVAGIASVENVASNAVAVQIADAAAQAAQKTAQGVTNALQSVVQNIMEENVVIYRNGFSDSFAALVAFTDLDTIAITSFEVTSKSAAAIVANIGYVCSANIGATKPVVMAHNTLTQLTDFTQVDAANVTTPTYTAGNVVYDGVTYSGTYSIQVTIPNPSSIGSYFYWIKLTGDGQSGNGATLDLNNGVTGGVSASVTWGNKVLTFTGGVLTGVADAN